MSKELTARITSLAGFIYHHKQEGLQIILSHLYVLRNQNSELFQCRHKYYLTIFMTDPFGIR